MNNYVIIPSILTNRLVLCFHIFGDISNGVMKKNYTYFDWLYYSYHINLFLFRFQAGEQEDYWIKVRHST